MPQDSTNLNNLVDIVMSEPVSIWPLAMGWWFMLALIAIWSTAWVTQCVQRWKQNRYRREAIKLLKQIESTSKNQKARTLVQLDALLKRVALAAYPRARVASLSGQSWIKFLEETGNDASFQQSPVARLGTAAADIGTTEPSEQQLEVIFETCYRWIRSHAAEAPAC